MFVFTHYRGLILIFCLQEIIGRNLAFFTPPHPQRAMPLYFRRKGAVCIANTVTNHLSLLETRAFPSLDYQERLRQIETQMAGMLSSDLDSLGSHWTLQLFPPKCLSHCVACSVWTRNSEFQRPRTIPFSTSSALHGTYNLRRAPELLNGWTLFLGCDWLFLLEAVIGFFAPSMRLSPF